MNKASIEEELCHLEKMMGELLAPFDLSLKDAFDVARRVIDESPEKDWESLADEFGFTFPGLASITRCRDIIEGDPEGLVDEGHEAASYWLCRAIADTWAAWGFAGMIATEKASMKRAISEMARKANAASHSKHHKDAANLMAWYEARKSQFKSLDAAAAVAADVHSVAFRTARKHIGEVAKKLRSARKE